MLTPVHHSKDTTMTDFWHTDSCIAGQYCQSATCFQRSFGPISTYICIPTITWHQGSGEVMVRGFWWKCIVDGLAALGHRHVRQKGPPEALCEPRKLKLICAVQCLHVRRSQQRGWWLQHSRPRAVQADATTVNHMSSITHRHKSGGNEPFCRDPCLSPPLPLYPVGESPTAYFMMSTGV